MIASSRILNFIEVFEAVDWAIKHDGQVELPPPTNNPFVVIARIPNPRDATYWKLRWG